VDRLALSDQYIASIYWAITTMSTIGFGDIVPVSTSERLVALVCMLLGAAIFAYGITQMCALVANLNASDAQFQRTMDDLNEYFDYRHLPKELRAQLREFFHYKRNSSGMFFQEDQLLAEMSDGLRLQVQLWVNQKLLRRVPFLREADEGFILQVVDKLRKAVYGPGEVVVRQGEEASNMFFIASGSVSVVVGHDTVVATLSEGNMFGEIAVCINTMRAATVRTQTYAELYSLHRVDFDVAVKHFPNVMRQIKDQALRRLRETLRARLRKAVRIIFAANVFLARAGLPSLGAATESAQLARVPSDSVLSAFGTPKKSHLSLPGLELKEASRGLLAPALGVAGAAPGDVAPLVREALVAQDVATALQANVVRALAALGCGERAPEEAQRRFAALLVEAGEELRAAGERAAARVSRADSTPPDAPDTPARVPKASAPPADAPHPPAAPPADAQHAPAE